MQAFFSQDAHGNRVKSFGKCADRFSRLSARLGKRSACLGNPSLRFGKWSAWSGRRSERFGNLSTQVGKRSERPGKRSERLGKRSERLGAAFYRIVVPRRRLCSNDAGVNAAIDIAAADNDANFFAFEPVNILKDGSERKGTGRFAFQICKAEVKS